MTNNITFLPLGTTEEELFKLVQMGLKYDKRQRRQMLAAAKPLTPSLNDIQELEVATGHLLPKSYREFLLNNNGGRPTKSHVLVPNIGSKVVHSFHALTSGGYSFTIRHFMDVYKGRIPEGMIPVANDPRGNLFLICAIPAVNFGTIHFWDHNQEADHESQPYYDNIYFVARSFDEFVDSLR